MRRATAAFAFAALTGLLGTLQTQEAATRPASVQPDTTEADPLDVRHIRSIVDAYYEVVSGPAGQARDWGRFRSLFLPGARLVTVTAGQGGGSPMILSADQFAEVNRKYFEGVGYSERSIRDEIDRFGHMAQVLSTYEARRGADTQPYSRGVNSFQLVRSGHRWWIAAVAWDREREGTTIPIDYLPVPEGHP